MADASLYRRHRPRTFDEVVGQEHVVRTLRNAVERDRVHHAYLFVGSRGTGKTSVAKILARSLNCVHGPTVTPCGECESCLAIAAGTSLDVIEMDAASNRSVDDIRELRERVGYAPAAGRWKVYILDEAHMLTREAWNAFLKTLEEPPPNTVFVLATTEPHKVMPTIVDRCQRFDFRRPSSEQIAGVVRSVSALEEIEIEDGAVAAISRAASGSFRDALGTLDQLVAYGGKRVETDDVLEVLGVADAELILAAADAIAAGDGRAALEASERLAGSGRDVVQFARDLVAHLRRLLVIRTVGEVTDALDVIGAGPERLRSQTESFTDLTLTRAIDSLSAALSAVREGDEPRMTIELALLRAARPQLDPSREALLERIERLEGSVEGTGGTPPAHASSTTTAHAPSVSDQHSRDESPRPQQQPAEPDEQSAAESESSADEGAQVTSESGESSVAQAVAAVDLERVRDLWPALVDRVREQGSELLSHILAAARPVRVDAEAQRLEVGFPPSAIFNKRKAENAEARDRLADAVKAIVGVPLRPVFVSLDSEPDDAASGEIEELSEDELIERLKSEFQAEEYDDDEGKEAAG